MIYKCGGLTYQQALDRLPPGSKWSCSFGNPGSPGYHEFWRTPDRLQRYDLSNGVWDMPDICNVGWSVEVVA